MALTRISIIIPTLNEEKQINRVIQTLLERSGRTPIEIIVADGGSSDNTVKVARLAGARAINCKHRGRGRQMNEGAKCANSSVLYFLHADTIPPEGYTNRINHALLHGADAGAFRLQFDDDHPALRLFAWFTRLDLDLFRFGDQSLFITRECFREIGGFRDELTVMEDQEIIRRIRKAGHFQLLDEPVVTSARKYRKYGVLRLQMIFTFIWAGYYLGMSQDALVHFYRNQIRV